jgi:RNA-directed DNA polymerase
LAMSLATPEKIRILQRKLYRKSKAGPAFRFYRLYDKIYREDIFRHAYALTRANAGAPGTDGMTFAAIEALGLESWLAGLREELISKTYRPDPVRRVMIPKPDGGERRLTSRTPRAGRWTRSEKCTGMFAGVTPTWSTPIYPTTLIRFQTTNS